MQTYCKLKTGEVMVVWSDNTAEGTYDLMPVGYDPEVDVCTTVSHEDVLVVDTNLWVVGAA